MIYAGSLSYVPRALVPGHVARRLTVREQQIVDLYIAGRSRAEIAAALGLQPGTVGGHIAGAAIKLGLRKRTALAFAVMLASRSEEDRGRARASA